MTATPAGRRAGQAPDRPPRPPGPQRVAARLWQASPLTYVALIVAVRAVGRSRSTGSFVVATRDQRRRRPTIPPPLTAGRRTSATTSTGCSTTTDAHFLIGLVNSLIVSHVVTVSVVFFSTLAGFAFAKLRFRGATRCCWSSSSR